MSQASPPKADIGISGPVDGMGEPDRAGAYLQITVTTRDYERRYRISLGAAEVLAAEILGSMPG